VSAPAWPDVVIGIVVIFGTLKGFKRGFIAELTGALALAFAVAAAFFYAGGWDGFVRGWTHLSPGPAHVIGMVLYSAAAYAIVLALGAALATVAKLPLIGTANAILGAAVGLIKAAVFAWAVLYVALFFSLSPDVREDLHRSALVSLLQIPNSQLDGTLRASLPPFVQPYADALFARHRV
jgi:uncharacterized membrane protein required for colicin V production